MENKVLTREEIETSITKLDSYDLRRARCCYDPASVRTILNMKMCPKCNKTTLEPTLDCVVPPEMIRLLQKPIANDSDARVMPYFCLSCRRVELYPVGT
jgi:hypothetical protein